MHVLSGHHAAPVTCGQFTPDGRYLVTAAQDSTLVLWDPRTGMPVWKMSGTVDGRWHQTAVTALAISADSQLVMTGGEDGRAMLVQAETGRCVGVLAGHSESVESVSFCDVLPVVATASMDGFVRVWEMNSLLVRASCRHDVGK